MKAKEAIKAIKDNKPTHGYTILCEALEMAIEALEKQIPKKVVKQKMKIKDCIDQAIFFEKTVCPSCGERMCCDWKFCFECGQKLDWGD